jgi:excisionase family DNA binding protein
MSISEAASRLNVSVDSVRRRLRSGAINGARDERGQWWLEVSDSIQPEPRIPPVEQRLALGVAIPAQKPVDDGHDLAEALQARIDDLLARLDNAETERREDKAKAASERDRLLTLIETLAGRGAPK